MGTRKKVGKVQARHSEICLRCYSTDIQAFKGEREDYTFDIYMPSGEPLKGLGVGFSGSALDHVSIVSVKALQLSDSEPSVYNSYPAEAPRIIAGMPTFIVPGVTLKPTVGCGLALKNSLKAKSASKGVLRTFKDAYFDELRTGCKIQLALKGKKAGIGKLEIIVAGRVATGAVLVHPTISITVHSKPYRPQFPIPALRSDRYWASVGLKGYAGSDLLLGWMAWDTRFESIEPSLLSWTDTLSAFLLDAVGRDYLSVKLMQAGRCPPGKNRAERGGSLSDAGLKKRLLALRREGVLTLAVEIPNDEHPDRTRYYSINLTNQPLGDTRLKPKMRNTCANIGTKQPRPVEFAWVLPRPRNPGAELELSNFASRIMHSAADDPGCLGAFVLAEGGCHHLGALTLYESLSEFNEGTYLPSHSKEWLKTNIRTPAWQVLVPKSAAGRLKKAPSGLSVEKLKAGTLVRMPAATPFAVTHAMRRNIENFLRPVLPSGKEWDSFCAKKFVE